MRITIRTTFALMAAIACCLAFNFSTWIVVTEQTRKVPIPGVGYLHMGQHFQTGWPFSIYHLTRQAEMELAGSSTDGGKIYQTKRYSESVDPIAITVNSLVAIGVCFTVVFASRRLLRLVSSGVTPMPQGSNSQQ